MLAWRLNWLKSQITVKSLQTVENQRTEIIKEDIRVEIIQNKKIRLKCTWWDSEKLSVFIPMSVSKSWQYISSAICTTILDFPIKNGLLKFISCYQKHLGK